MSLLKSISHTSINRLDKYAFVFGSLVIFIVYVVVLLPSSLVTFTSNLFNPTFNVFFPVPSTFAPISVGTAVITVDVELLSATQLYTNVLDENGTSNVQFVALKLCSVYTLPLFLVTVISYVFVSPFGAVTITCTLFCPTVSPLSPTILYLAFLSFVSAITFTFTTEFGTLDV